MMNSDSDKRTAVEAPSLDIVVRDLRKLMNGVPLGIVERDTFIRILRYAIDGTLTTFQVKRMAQLSETWFRDAVEYDSAGTCSAADEAFYVATLYDEFARALAPHAQPKEVDS